MGLQLWGKDWGYNEREVESYRHSYEKCKGKCGCYSLDGMQSACSTSPTQQNLKGTNGRMDQSGDTKARLCQNHCREGNSVVPLADKQRSS